MNRIVKIFCPKTEQQQLSSELNVIEKYDAFVLAEISTAKLNQVARKYPVEDITDQYAIRIGEEEISTSRPRVAVQGKVRPHSAYRDAKPLSKGRHHYLVQFVGPIKAEWLSDVKGAGGEPRRPQGDFNYIVRADEKVARAIASLPSVRWVGHLPHALRIAPALMQSVAGGGKKKDRLPRTIVMPGIYTVEFFGAEDMKAAIPLVKKLGLKILDQEPKASLLIVQVPEGVKLNREKVMALAAVHGVKFIRERSLKRTTNNVASGIMNTAASTATSGLALTGSGETVAVCDTGLDTGIASTIHPDFKNRVAWIKSYPITSDFSPFVLNPGGDDGPADVESGHGTHVAGSVLGDGSAGSGLTGLAAPIRGLAYKARLVFQAVQQEMKWKPNVPANQRRRYLLSGIPNDLSRLFADAYQKGARIHSNSWGGGDPGAYDSQCEQLDRFVWEHKDFCVLAAAGNDGTDNDGDGKINPMSVSSPATAKNCITVGACENLRPEFNGERYGDWWAQDYPVGPFASDPMANNPLQVVAFSSRGPTQDGRIKPDVVAPGTFILSTRSTQIASNNMAWAAFPASRLYFHMGGTSMATPLTAGAVALIRQYFRRTRGVTNPTAALLKAALIAGAKRLGGYASRSALVDPHQGYGRVNLDATLAPPSPASLNFLESTPGLRTGQLQSIEISVKSNKSPLRVVLVYSDFPGPSLVNNLNLILTSPSRRRYVGNQSAGNILRFDTMNNVEVVQVKKPAAGKWKIDVIGSNVPRGPQDFALVWTGHVEE